jgi:DDB1- and CUL4-associated factor 11
MSTGTCSVHSWNDGVEEDESELPVGRRVNHKLEEDPRYYAQPTRNAPGLTRRAGLRSQAVAMAESEEDEESGW